MGQTLACCGKSEVDSNDVKTGNFYQEQSLLQAPKFAALNNQEKVAIVTKIQAAIRGYIDRKRIYQFKVQNGFRSGQEGVGAAGGMMIVNYPVGPDG